MNNTMDGIAYLRAYTDACCEGMLRTDFETLSEIADILLLTRKNGGRIFTAGNGGSAATASHICNDLIKGTRTFERPGFKAFCLGDATPVITCLGNDYSYEDIFRIQLETQAETGDVLLAFSGSGNSENVVRAAIAARDRGVTVIGLLGRDGGKLKAYCDRYVIAPTDCMEMIEDMHMLYCHALVSLLKEKLSHSWGAEIIRPAGKRKFQTALFDFDGTVSLIRANWRDIMLPYFTDVLVSASPGTDSAILREKAANIIDSLTGKQTIFQCIALDELVQELGGAHVDPEIYKQGFLDRMHERVQRLKAGLKEGTITVEECLVPGAAEWIRYLESRGVVCYLASGTDEDLVREEAKLLGVDTIFSGGIIGAKKDQSTGIKEELLEKLKQEGRPLGEELICFGDGPSEILATKKAGGYTVGIAMDENTPLVTDMRKRDLLLKCGADMIIPDFSEPEALAKLLGLSGNV